MFACPASADESSVNGATKTCSAKTSTNKDDLYVIENPEQFELEVWAVAMFNHETPE
jgi:hypothetical protein